jgi:exonuclease SbcC
MRPLRLDLAGFTVFREPTTVDLTDADFFALVGPTGAGKSTLLDAICFALYGTVPRWDDRRSIENALAPSAAEARVRLVFQAGGARFVATRVVRRDSKGKVNTTHAGLEQLPAGFDLSTFDTAPAQRGEASLGVVLAGTPAEMESAVLDAVGLPYEQFTRSVMLPQGDFARFLHAKPKERQDILVNLLGLHVYRRIAERAGLAQRDAETAASAARSLLGDVTGADDTSLAAARRAVAAAEELAGALEAELPALAAAASAGEAARADLAAVEQELKTLAAVRVPDGLPSLGAQATRAQETAERADAAVLAAEEREEKLRAELAAAGDRAALQRLLDLIDERGQLAVRVKKLAAAVTAATAEHAKAEAAHQKAVAKAQTARAAVAQAQEGVEAAQTADRAATLRVHLVAGEPCPVCEQDVTAVPAMPRTPALTAARKRHADAEKSARATVEAEQLADRALRQLDRGLAAATAQHDESAHRLTTVDGQLATAPPAETVRAELAALASVELALGAAAEQVRTARQAARESATEAKRAQDRLRGAWREFDTARDMLATFEPPAPDRDDLVGSWQGLGEWALDTGADRARTRDALVEVAAAALATLTAQAERLSALFGTAGVAAPARSVEPADYRHAAALAAERASAGLARVREKREQLDRLAEQVAGKEREAQVAKALALHLRSDRFERWLLAEALDALVHGASRILRELSGGQYDLTHDKGEFFVVDHADAGLRRGVRTLSGGETFQASLALALALSEQLAGLSTASASLESIMLDEGFGTLDTSTLDTVAATLENLAAQGDRVVGVVTHVVALAERVPVRFEVTKDARGMARVERMG